MPPIYDWQCKKCKQYTEIDRRMSESDKPPEKCKHCEHEELSKVISKGTSFHLEGGGWFSDGY